MITLFKNKNFSLLFAGSLVSEIGNTLYSFAISLYILTVTGSSTQMGFFLAVAIGVRLIFTPLAGTVVDKLSRIKIIYWADYIRGFLFAIATIILLYVHNSNSIILMLYILTIFSSIFGSFFSPAVNAVVPEIVKDEDIHRANSGLNIIQSIQSIFGVLLGAVIYSILGLLWVFAINVVSFIISAVSEMFIHPEYTIAPSNEEKDYSFKDGLRYMKKRKGLLSLLAIILLMNFSITPIASIGLPYLFNNLLLRQPLDLAITEVVMSLSFLVSGIVIASNAIKNSNKTIKQAILLNMIGFIGLGIDLYLISSGLISYTLFYIIILVLFAFIGVQLIYINIPIQTGITIATEASYRGRVFSIIATAAQLAMPFALIIGGYILENLSIIALTIFSTIFIIIASLLFILNKNVEHLFNGIDEQIRASKEVA